MLVDARTPIKVSVSATTDKGTHAVGTQVYARVLSATTAAGGTAHWPNMHVKQPSSATLFSNSAYKQA